MAHLLLRPVPYIYNFQGFFGGVEGAIAVSKQWPEIATDHCPSYFLLEAEEGHLSLLKSQGSRTQFFVCHIQSCTNL